MSDQVVLVRREAVEPCMTCPLCHEILREATTIIECLHTFCRKCIHRNLADVEKGCCPVCNIDLGCLPLDKLRPDHNLQALRTKIYPSKRMKDKIREVVNPVVLPAKRKEISLSSLVVNAPRVSGKAGKTGRRIKSVAKRVSRSSNFTIKRHITKDDDSMEVHPENSSSPEIIRKSTRSRRVTGNFAAGEPSNHPILDRGKEIEFQKGQVDFWKPLTCLVEAADRSNSSQFEQLNSCDNEGFRGKSRNKGQRKKSKLEDEKNCRDRMHPEKEKPKRVQKLQAKKAQSSLHLSVPPQRVLNAATAKSAGRYYPIWFSLVASDEMGRDGAALPQISANYLRVNDGNIPVSLIQKYIKRKLNLTSEDEVEIQCMGQTAIPTLTLDYLVDLWLQTAGAQSVSATVGSSAKDFVMVLTYGRRAP